MLYTTELAYSLPRDSFERLLEAVDALHSHVWIYTGNDGENFHYNSAKGFNWFLKHHEDPANLKHSYSMMVQMNYVYIPLGIYAYLAAITKYPGSSAEETSGRIERYFNHHFSVTSTFQKKHAAHMFAHLYRFLESEDKPVLDSLMQRLLYFSPQNKHRESIKLEKLLWNRNLNVLCPLYGHEYMADSGIYTGITKHLGGDDALLAWVKESLPSRLRADFMKASGREDLLLQALSAGAKRTMLNDELGL